jgi:hypothetical protein
MGILATLKGLFAPRSYAETEFGLGDIPFFLALLRACPDGSRLTFHQSETESFVHAFREWSHRTRPQDFEADHYTMDRRFVAAAERLAADGELRLDHHFTIVAPDDRLLCDSLDDFTIVTLADDIRQSIRDAVA